MSFAHPSVVAHRGFASRQPEMTVAAYRAAIAWAVENNVSLGLECDVHFSADDELICLHDLRLDRTTSLTGLAHHRTLAELRQMDFGSWKVSNPTAEQQRIITLRELLGMVGDAREQGHDICLSIETKHPNPRGLAVEEAVAELLTEFGWHRAGSPVRIITFFVDGIITMGELLPEIDRTLLVESVGVWDDGSLPPGVRTIGPDVKLLQADPDLVARAHAYGHEVHVWTVNDVDEIELCLSLGVDSYTTDYPDRVLAMLDRHTSRQLVGV